MSTEATKQEKRATEPRLDKAEAARLTKQKAELSSRILALKAESAKIAGQLIGAGHEVPACW